MKKIYYTSHLELRLELREIPYNLPKRIYQTSKVIHYDPQSDVFYIGIKRAKEEECVELAPGVNVELDEGGKVIGIEILNASKTFRPVSKSLKQSILQPVSL